MPVITGYNLRCEGPQRLAHRAFAQPLQGAVAQLADALARDAEHAADLFQRVLPPAVQPEVEAQHLGVALLQAVQGRLDLVGQEAVHRLLFRIREVFGDEALDQRAVAVGVERRIEAYVAGVERGERLHDLERQLRGVGDLLRRRLAAQRLPQVLRRAHAARQAGGACPCGGRACARVSRPGGRTSPSPRAPSLFGAPGPWGRVCEWASSSVCAWARG